MTPDERRALIDLLLRLPNSEQRATRDALLAGLPPALRTNLARNDVPRLDVVDMVAKAEDWGGGALDLLTNMRDQSVSCKIQSGRCLSHNVKESCVTGTSGSFQ